MRLSFLSALLLSIFCSVVILTACGVTDPASQTDAPPNPRCIDGVTYLFFKGQSGYAGYGYMSVKFNEDGTVSTCEGE